MERTTSLTKAKQIIGKYFIGPDELTLIADIMDIKIPSEIPAIPYSLEELVNKKRDYILILGLNQTKNGEPITLKTLRDFWGVNPDLSEPCFYNQDWYINEDFFHKPLDLNWFLIRKEVFQETRAKNPENLINNYAFPSALICAYSFFVIWSCFKEYLWQNDFIWCNDIDANGDRIYVARYYDPKGISKNGFSIHRHLRIRANYGCI